MAAATIVIGACAGCDRDRGTESPDTELRAPHAATPPAEPEATPPTYTYPTAARGDQADTYHGITVPDPYRWLEDIDGPQTRRWIEAQNALTFGYLEDIEVRERLRQMLKARWDFARWGVPQREGPRYLVTRNDGLQDQSVLYTLDTLAGTPKVLLDPNRLSSDGTVALAGREVSPDGRRMAYGVSAAGSDWQTWRVRDVATAQDTTDLVEWIKFSGVAWSADNKGFYYSRYEAPTKGAELEAVNEGQKLYYHRVGTAQSEDRLVYANAEQPKWGYAPQVTHDGRYLVVTVEIGTERNNAIFVQDLGRNKRPPRGKEPVPKMVQLRADFGAHWEFIGNEGSRLWFITDFGAPLQRIVEIDLESPKTHRELVPEQSATLRGVKVVGTHFVASYLQHAHGAIRIFDREGKPTAKVTLPGIGSVSGLTGSVESEEAFLSFASFAQPGQVLRLDAATGKTEAHFAEPLPFDPARYVTEQSFVTSKDGKTKVPVFVSRRADIEPNRERPTYLYAYGGFDIPITPSFSVPNLVWMELGGVLAVANLRGGGEYGKAWHLAGTKTRKQNVFDDFESVATWLVGAEAGWTRPDRIVVGGRSNGGLLIGAALTQFPERFGVALPGVGVMDMLRFDEFTIGWAWRSDYGSKEIAAEFAALLAYSPYHNATAGQYPATLLYTADHDDRVVPAHSYKFAAALQHAQRGDAPVMIRIDTKAGHGRGKPVSKQIDEWADLWGFAIANMDGGFAWPDAAGQGG